MIQSYVISKPYIKAKKFITRSVIFCCLSLFQFTGYGQNDLTITSFLKSAQDSEMVALGVQNLQFLGDINYGLPVVRSVELRSETRDLLLSRQEYSLRIKPNSLTAVSRQKGLFQNKIEEVSIENKIKFNRDLEERYIFLIDYIFTTKLIAITDQYILQLKDKLKILGQNIYDTNFDVKELIETEEQLLETNLKRVNLAEELADKHIMLLHYLNNNDSNVNLKYDELIGPEQVANTSIGSIIPEPSGVTLQKIKLETLESEMLLDKAKSNQIFDYFQAKYGGKNSELFDENFSIGLGINLPFFGNTRKIKGDYYFEKLNKEAKLKQELKNFVVDLEQSRSYFKRTITEYQVLELQIKESSVVSLLNTYRKMEGVSPILLLKLNILQLRKRMEVLKAEQQMYLAYIANLAKAEVLFQRPLRNYLSGTLELIED